MFAVGNRGIVIDRRPVALYTLQHFHQAGKVEFITLLGFYIVYNNLTLLYLF